MTKHHSIIIDVDGRPWQNEAGYVSETNKTLTARKQMKGLVTIVTNEATGSVEAAQIERGDITVTEVRDENGALVDMPTSHDPLGRAEVVRAAELKAIIASDKLFTALDPTLAELGKKAIIDLEYQAEFRRQALSTPHRAKLASYARKAELAGRALTDTTVLGAFTKEADATGLTTTQLRDAILVKAAEYDGYLDEISAAVNTAITGVAAAMDEARIKAAHRAAIKAIEAVGASG